MAERPAVAGGRLLLDMMLSNGVMDQRVCNQPAGPGD